MKLRENLSLKEFSANNMEKLGYVHHKLSGYKRKTYFSPPFISLIKNGIEIHSNLVGKDKTIVRIEE